MHRFYISLLIGLSLAACQGGTPGASTPSPGKDYLEMEGLLSVIEMASGDTIACSELAFGPTVSNGPSVLPIRLIQGAIPRSLQEEAGFLHSPTDGEPGFDSLSLYYGLGKMDFGPNKSALLIGRHRNERQYSTHMFVYDKEKAEFVSTQSLNFVLEGGNYRGVRDAWITDINGDGTPDVIYNFSADFSPEDPGLAYVIRDSMHVEVWTGTAFANTTMSDPDGIRAALGLGAGI